MNLAAPYICRDFISQLNQLMPYIDILFSNDVEAKEYASVLGIGTDDIKQMALKLCNLTKVILF